MNQEENKIWTYSKLKEWFRDNREALPDTLGNDFMLITDLRFCIDAHIAEIESAISSGIVKQGEAGGNRTAIASKRRLITIYEMLQNPENHNKKMIPLTEFSNMRAVHKYEEK